MAINISIVPALGFLDDGRHHHQQVIDKMMANPRHDIGRSGLPDCRACVPPPRRGGGEDASCANGPENVSAIAVVTMPIRAPTAPPTAEGVGGIGGDQQAVSLSPRMMSRSKSLGNTTTNAAEPSLAGHSPSPSPNSRHLKCNIPGSVPRNDGADQRAIVIEARSASACAAHRIDDEAEQRQLGDGQKADHHAGKMMLESLSTG
ncbi:hypothetical protein [Devosia ginsengisoli]|uniref:Uncharacterized protein n=1 Tax=Devosia ginsengisoli TaxID=400770 RepID=A0A5B8LNQ0_9HYPH|nr:hypothetical protein [Devosia ginsengisoli]QDZ09284.1 hypothetical protein FPZ08_00010 [Devosia ginsengisoli]